MLRIINNTRKRYAEITSIEKSVLPIIFLIVTFGIPCISHAKFRKVLTKTRVNDIRYMVKDEELFYFQDSFGTLSLFDKSRTEKVIKGSRSSHFTIQWTPSNQLILSNSHSFTSDFTTLNPAKIYLLKKGSTDIQEIGKGINPKYHSFAQKLSWYNPKQRKIFLYDIKQNKQELEIDLPKHFSFIRPPQIVLNSSETIYFTGLNSKGFDVVMSYDMLSNEFLPFYQSQSEKNVLEICREGVYLTLLEFVANRTSKDKKIKNRVIRVNFSDPALPKEEILTSDIVNQGHLTCFGNNHVGFLQSYRGKTQLFRLNIQDKKYQIYTTDFPINWYVRMENRIYTLEQSTLYSAPI